MCIEAFSEYFNVHTWIHVQGMADNTCFWAKGSHGKGYRWASRAFHHKALTILGFVDIKAVHWYATSMGDDERMLEDGMWSNMEARQGFARQDYCESTMEDGGN